MTPSNPYLANIPDRDVRTESGNDLTLVNPAYLLRQVMGFYADLYGVEGHLTSLNVINPDNRPDDWQRSALMALDEGVEEVFEFTEMHGEKHLRFMRPLMTEKEGLKCHAHQGYKVGDVRGGIEVAVPLKAYLEIEQNTVNVLLLSHGGFWVGGMIIIGFITNRGRDRII